MNKQEHKSNTRLEEISKHTIRSKNMSKEVIKNGKKLIDGHMIKGREITITTYSIE